MSTVTKVNTAFVGDILNKAKTGHVEFRKANGEARHMHFSRDFSKVKMKGTPVYDAGSKGITHVIDLDLPEGGNVRAVKWENILRLEVGDVIINWNSKDKAFVYATKKN